MKKSQNHKRVNTDNLFELKKSNWKKLTKDLMKPDELREHQKQRSNSHDDDIVTLNVL